MQYQDVSPAAAERFWSKVTKSDGCWPWTAGTYDDGYGCFWMAGRNHRAHRIAYVLTVHTLDDDALLDHECFNHQCVNPKHLRPVTVKQNGEHRAGPQINGRSGYRGVYKRSDRNKWAGVVRHNGVRHWLGNFDSPEDADSAVRAERARLFTHDDARQHSLADA